MNDDGTGARVLATSEQIPGMREIVDPSFGPTGNRIVFGAIRLDAQDAACGTNCTGVYVFDGGVATRLSGAPGGNCSDNCGTFENEPELSTTGEFAIFGFQTYQRSPFRFNGQPAVRQTSDGASVPLDTDCIDAKDPIPRPGTDEVVYSCDDDNTLWRTGADPAVGSDDMPIATDDQAPTDPAFSADGNTIVDAEEGADAGLWRIAYDGTVYDPVLPSPPGTTFSSPRLAGARVLFVTGKDVWSVPAVCPGCSFPDSATRLTTSGDVGTIGWTPSTEPVKALTTPQPPTNTNTTTTTTTTTTTNTNTNTTTETTAPTVTGFSLRGTAKKLKTALKNGVKVRAGCDKPCDLAGKAFIDAKTAKRYGLGKKRIAVASGRKAGVTGATSLTLKFTAKAKKKLAKAKTLKLAVELTATADSKTAMKKGSLTLKK
jgi:hypothetical protein